MGYPMTWGRVLSRNLLTGNYTRLYGWGAVPLTNEAAYPREVVSRLKMICGDLRRLEQDSIDGKYATEIVARRAGVDSETVIKVLTAFFKDAPKLPPHDAPFSQSPARKEEGK